MAFTKFANFEAAQVLDVKGSPTKLKTASLDKVSEYNDYRVEDGFMYVRIRAISSRVNKNNDGWPSIELAGSEEIFNRHEGATGFTVTANDEAVPRDDNGKPKYGFATFMGKPIFVDHNNTDPKRGRGVIADSKFRVIDHKTAASDDKYWNGEDVDPEHLPAAEVELLLEVDAERFPILAGAIKNGDIDGFSMGCDVEKTKCNICSNEATAPHEFCDHIRMKGATFDYHEAATGKRSSRKSYENCYGIRFFEISAVFDPADETALTRELVHKEAAGIVPVNPADLRDWEVDLQNAQGKKTFRVRGVDKWDAGRRAIQQNVAQGNPPAWIVDTRPVVLASVFNTPDPNEVMKLAQEFIAKGVDPVVAMDMASRQLSGRLHNDQVKGDDGMISPASYPPGRYDPMPAGFNPGTPRQGSPLQDKIAAIRNKKDSAGRIINNPWEEGEPHNLHMRDLNYLHTPEVRKQLNDADAGLTPQYGTRVQCPHCTGAGCGRCGGKGYVEARAFGQGGRDEIQRKFPFGMEPGIGIPMLPEQNTIGMHEHYLQNTDRNPIFPPGLINENVPRRQGNTQEEVTDMKQAANPAPQSELIRAPEDVDTLRKEEVCPVCGSDGMENGKCDVCGHEEPPPGLDTPDLEAAGDFNEESELGIDKGLDERAETPLGARKNQPTASVTDEMRWAPRIDPRVAGRVNTEERPIKPGQTPGTDEPNETVVRDEPTPVTSSTRNAADMIAVAGSTYQENSMSDAVTRTAAEPADPSGKPDKRVDVEGTGGIIDANNEAASKPENKHGDPGTGKTVDVEGKGGILQDSNAEASKPDRTEDVDKEVRTDDSGPTKTWSENNGTGAVTDKAFPNAQSYASVEAAKQGVKPIGGPDVQPQRRENVEQESGFSNPQDGTDQWTGTDGNGVLRQQDPVTKKVDPNIDQGRKSTITSHTVNVFKLADTEVALGLLDSELKYDRIAELEQESEEEVKARLDTLSRVKTAGLAKAHNVTVQRLPSLTASTTESERQEKTASADDPRYDDGWLGSF